MTNETETGEFITPLNQLTKQEFRDSTHYLTPITDEDFDAAWDRFQEAKRLKRMN